MSDEISTGESPGLSFTGRIAGWSARYRWVVLAGSVVVLAVAVLLNIALGVNTNQEFGAGESLAANRLIQDRFDRLEPPAEFILFSSPSLDVDDTAFRSTVERW